MMAFLLNSTALAPSPYYETWACSPSVDQWRAEVVCRDGQGGLPVLLCCQVAGGQFLVR